MNTHISNVIEGNADKSKYDAEIKKLLGDKTVLAWILKYSVEEFRDYSIEVIRDCIEGEPEIGTRNRTKGNPLHGMLTTLLSETLKPKEKEHILKEQYQFVTSVELEGDLERMCNLSERIEEKGIQKGIQEGELLQLVSLVKKGILSLEIALQEVKEDKKEQFLEMFQK